jgi:hypothetical protein
MRWWRAALIAGALALAIVPFPPAWVERWYADGVYSHVQPLITAFSNIVPFAIFDLLIAGTIAWLVWCVVADAAASRKKASASRKTRQWPRVALRALVRLLTTCAALYLLFLACWGMNYRRLPVTDRLSFDRGRASPGRARDLAIASVERVNALYPLAHPPDEATFDTASLSASFAAAARELGASFRALPARPKRSLLDRYFRLAAVDGMTDPYFLETLVVSDLLPFERPFVVAHEWAHLAGFADESEANFVGWLTCVHGTASEQYSGWLFLYSEIAGGLRRADYVQASARLASGPRQDLRAVSERVRGQQNQAVSAAGWRVYDSYLKANRVDAGTASYAAVVRVILGTEFDANWQPVLRSAIRNDK